MELLKFNIGDRVSCKKIFTADEIMSYSTTCMDNNPIHTDPGFAAKTKFG